MRCIFFLLASVWISVGISSSCVHVSDLASYQKTSSDYSISTATGLFIPVEEYQDYHVARFSSSCPSDHGFNVSVRQGVTSHVVSPQSKHFASSVDAVSGQLLLKLPSLSIHGDSHYVVVRVNEDLPLLLILVDRWDPAVDNFQANGRPVLDVTQHPYSADASGQSEATQAIQSALDDASAGSVVYVPAGTFSLTHTLNWTADSSGVELFLAPGSVLRTVPDLSRLTWDKKSSCLTLEPLMKLDGATDIAIRGRGTLDASGKALMAPPPPNKKSSSCTWAYRRHLIDSHYSKLKSRPQNITIEGVTLKDATTWTVRLDGVQNLLVQNVKVLNHKNSRIAKIQNDGLDLCANRDSVVRKNFVITNDDAMCLKASRAENEFNYETSTVNNTFEGNVVWTHCAGAKFGMQAKDKMSHSVFRDHDIIHARRGIVVEATSGALTMGPELVFDDVRIEELTDTVDEEGHSTSRVPIDVEAKTASIDGVLVRGAHFYQSVQNAGNSSINGSVDLMFHDSVSTSRRRRGSTPTMYVRDLRFVDLMFRDRVRTSSDQAAISINGNVSGVSFEKSESSLTIV